MFCASCAASSRDSTPLASKRSIIDWLAVWLIAEALKPLSSLNLSRSLLTKGEAHFQAALTTIGPFSVSALLLTLVLLFAFQGEAILRQPLIIAMLAVPILIQVFFNSALAYWLQPGGR